MITHAQASILRAISSIPPQHHPNLEWIERENLHGLIHAVWHGMMWTVCGLTGKGFNALADFDKEWVTVRRVSVGKLFEEATGFTSRGTSDEAIKEMLE